MGQQLGTTVDNNSPQERANPAGVDGKETFQESQYLPEEVDLPPPGNNASISIFRNEVIALTIVLGRIPQSFLSGENNLTSGLTVSVVKNLPGPNWEISPQYRDITDPGNLDHGIAAEYEPEEFSLRPSK